MTAGTIGLSARQETLDLTAGRKPPPADQLAPAPAMRGPLRISRALCRTLTPGRRPDRLCEEGEGLAAEGADNKRQAGSAASLVRGRTSGGLGG